MAKLVKKIVEDGTVNLVRYDFSVLTVVRCRFSFPIFQLVTTYIKRFTEYIGGFSQSGNGTNFWKASRKNDYYEHTESI
jgi:hypothetical protein